MQDYSVFGGTLRSEIPFPELRPATDTLPARVLSHGGASAPLPAGQLLGEDEVDPTIHVRLYRRGDGYRLEYDDTGTFDISGDGSGIVWYHDPAVRMELARLDIVGRVLATAMHASGILSLHGSAVALGAEPETIAFLAPKFHGKSTLAMAMVGAGARLVTDDTLPVDAGPPAVAWPGVHAVRLFGDSADRLGERPLDGADPFANKHLFSQLPESALMKQPSPLAAIYLLAPVTDRRPAGPAVGRTRLAGTAAAMSLILHAKLGPLLGGPEAATLFSRAIALARTVPVYSLEVLRDFDRLAEVAAQITAWHSSGHVPEQTMSLVR